MGSSVGVCDTELVVGVVVVVAVVPLEVVVVLLVKLLFRLSNPLCKLSEAERNIKVNASRASAASTAP